MMYVLMDVLIHDVSAGKTTGVVAGEYTRLRAF